MVEQNYISGQTSVKIAASIEAAIAAGRVAAGHSLPTVRAVATAREVSTATVAAAYRLLRDRGLVVADGRRGTRVRGVAAMEPDLAALDSDATDLASGNPDPALLPSLRDAVGKLDVAPRLYNDLVNHAPLLEAAAKQFAADDVPHESITVVGGALDGIERVLREHLRAGDRVIVEDPCFTGVSEILAALALTPVAVAVDDEGFVPDDLRRALQRPAAALIVTPRAQNPTGAAISPKRRRMLRGVLKTKPDLLVIEDDHAGPIAGAPYATLVDGSRSSWAVVRSVSKSLGPDLRLAVMATDPLTASRIQRRQQIGIRWVSHLLQQIVVRLWRDPATARTLAKAGRAYAARRQMLLRALAEHGIAAHGASGLNVWIPVPAETVVIASLLQRGWAVQAGERYRLASPPAIRVTIATLDQENAVRFAADLAAILRPRGGVRV